MDNDDSDFDVDDFSPDEIQEMLAAFGSDVSLEQAEQMARLVAEAGGIDAAIAALAGLGSVEKDATPRTTS